MKALYCLIACLMLAPSSAASASSDDVRLVLKFAKEAGVEGPAAVFDPASCLACTSVQDPAFARDNERETLVDLRVPRQRTLDLVFQAPQGGVRRVIVQTDDIAFSRDGDRLTVHLPPLADDAIAAGEFATHIAEPGMVLRFEHDDLARRSGAYATAPADFVERRAADNLVFAEREVIRRLELGVKVQREALGAIMVMGFETNYPHGHTDAPGHIHMHMRWPSVAGTQIGHYYLGQDGLFTKNMVDFQHLKAPRAELGRGTEFTTVDRFGRGVYSHEITPEGWLRIRAIGGAACLISPVAEGFQSGAVVACDGDDPTTIRVSDDLGAGKLRVRTGMIEEIFVYDRDTGALLSADAPPPVSAVGYPPGGPISARR